jgi:hypothetical protein
VARAILIAQLAGQPESTVDLAVWRVDLAEVVTTARGTPRPPE